MSFLRSVPVLGQGIVSLSKATGRVDISNALRLLDLREQNTRQLLISAGLVGCMVLGGYAAAVLSESPSALKVVAGAAIGLTLPHFYIIPHAIQERNKRIAKIDALKTEIREIAARNGKSVDDINEAFKIIDATDLSDGKNANLDATLLEKTRLLRELKDEIETTQTSRLTR